MRLLIVLIMFLGLTMFLAVFLKRIHDADHASRREASHRADHLGLTMLMLRIVLIMFLGLTMLTLLLAVRLLIVLIMYQIRTCFDIC